MWSFYRAYIASFVYVAFVPMFGATSIIIMIIIFGGGFGIPDKNDSSRFSGNMNTIVGIIVC